MLDTDAVGSAFDALCARHVRLVVLGSRHDAAAGYQDEQCNENDPETDIDRVHVPAPSRRRDFVLATQFERLGKNGADQKLFRWQPAGATVAAFKCRGRSA